jgi:hypothetical protein
MLFWETGASDGLFMKTVFRRAALASIIGLAGVSAPALAEEKPSAEPLHEITLDIDNDGKTDRAAIVRSADGAQADLYVYLAAGDGKLDLSRKPTFLKKAITEGSVRGLETGDGSLIVTSCYGCGARKSWDETLTVVHRDGEFLVARYAKDWDWGNEIRKPNGEWDVDTIIRGCDVDFLMGKGVVTEGLDGESEPIEGKFEPVKLADWSDDTRPKACEP